MIRKKIYRMSGPVVVIGFLFLIPSVIMMLCFGGCAIVGLGAAGGTPAVARTEAIAEMVGVGVAESSAEAFLDDTDSLIPEGSYSEAQVATIEHARVSYDGAVAAAGLGGGMAVIVSIIGIVGSFVGGLLGWILIMKKKVLQCTHCQAVVNAS